MEEKIIVLNLRKDLIKTWKRSEKASRVIKKLLSKKLKKGKIKIDSKLNHFVWSRGMKRPPMKIKIRVVKEGDTFKAYLVK